MKPAISETTYSHAVCRELEVKYKFILPPEFPSLVKEGRKKGGYDLKIFPSRGRPIFYQFKLSDYLTGPRAAEYSYLVRPYYRMYIRALKYSKQHKLLLKLEKEGENVFYMAPLFHSNSDFSKFYFQRNIIKNSFQVRPECIGYLPDQKAHYCDFSKKSLPYFYFNSDPLLLNKSFPENALGLLRRESEESIESARKFYNDEVRQYDERGEANFAEEIRRNETILIDDKYFDQVGNILTEEISETYSSGSAERKLLNELRRVNENALAYLINILQIFLSANLFILPEEN